ncbi:MAG: 5-formyltetrahydrofolate cyclo-ligase [Patescibacteria group bacterium]
MNPEEELLQKLQAADALIGYSPMSDEPDVHDFLVQHKILKPGRSIVADKNVSPHDFAHTLSEAHQGQKICVLIPGSEFDREGTRHGRGGGWYDRFLKEAPREWLRIGVLNALQFSEEKLKREPWDEPVDFLLIQDKNWTVITTQTNSL